MKKFLCVVLCVLFVLMTGCVLFPEKADWEEGNSYNLLDNEYVNAKIIKHNDSQGRQTFTFEATNKKDCEVVFHVTLLAVNGEEDAVKYRKNNTFNLTLAPEETVIMEEGFDFSVANVDKVEKIKFHIGVADKEYYELHMSDKAAYQSTNYYELSLGKDIAIEMK